MSESSRADSPHATDELDLAIPDMNSVISERQVQEILDRLPGLQFVRLVERGAFIRYHASTITKDQIVAALRQSGFRASTFQDSKTGETGVSSQ